MVAILTELKGKLADIQETLKSMHEVMEYPCGHLLNAVSQIASAQTNTKTLLDMKPRAGLSYQELINNSTRTRVLAELLVQQLEVTDNLLKKADKSLFEESMPPLQASVKECLKLAKSLELGLSQGLN